MHEAAELDEWVPQCARIEDELRELKRRGTSVDFMELNDRTCRWPLFEGNEPFYEKLELVRCPEALIAPRMKVRPSPGEQSRQGGRVL